MLNRSAVALAAALAAWCCGIAPALGSDDVARLEQRIRTSTLEQANRQASDLVRDLALQSVARSHSGAMYRLRTLAHVLRDHMGPERRVACNDGKLFGLVAENVGYLENWPASTDLAQRFVEAWMNSPEHRRNILSSYRILEVGCQGDGTIMYCTQDFVRSIHRMEHAVPRHLTPGQSLTVRLEQRAGSSTSGLRLSLAPAGGGGQPSTVVFDGGAASMTVPAAAGWYRLNLWVPEPDDPHRFRVIGGPYVRVGAATSGPCSPQG